VVQTRIINSGDGVGYGLEFRAGRPSRLATVSIGYADGISRVLGNRGAIYFCENALPIVGRLSMDSMVIGLNDAVADAITDGSSVDLIGPGQSIDDLARSVGTIGYEVLAGLGPRIERIYR
jgi:alanine racemase